MTTAQDTSLNQRTGYDPDFVGPRIQVPVGVDAADAVLVHGSPVIHYTRFSLALSKSRRLCRWVAWNIDGATLPGPDGPDTIGRDDLEFTLDGRIEPDLQIANDVYKNNRLDRGHVARRADLLWGRREEALIANSDSFYFTNITPQMDNFNQSALKGIWGRLENALLTQVDEENSKVTVMGGPVLAATDPHYRDVQVPLEFWKLFVYQKDNDIRSRAFLVTQSLEGLRERDLLDEFIVVERSVQEIADKAAVEFDPALHTLQRRGRTRTPEPARSRVIGDESDITW
ncbi:MAG: DNA/RNA non-specific endonuclease [Mycobacterium sp.]